ncbi:pds5, partial [Symbiodinium pilosum]
MAGGRAKAAKAMPSKTKGTASSVASAPTLSREDALQSLQKAFDTLKFMPQGQGDADSARTLCQPNLIRHASGEVRLWASKCLAEVLRIFVPSPPFETERFPPIMELFLEQLSLLRNPSAATYAYAFELLERLEEIRGFMLIFDCSPADVESLIVSLADTCITAAK